MNRFALALGLCLISFSSQAFAQCTADTPYASRYPVAGPVNGGYDRSLDGTGSATYNCEGLHSNSDYVAGDHHGNDFFAAFRTPIIAVTDGVIDHVGWETGLGNRVGIRDACGWIYDAGHLDEIAPGWVVDATVHAGDLLGYMGLTGARSNGVNHLHFNVHMAGLAWADDVDPFIAVGPVADRSCWPVGPSTPRFRAAYSMQSFPLAASPFSLYPGQEVAGFIELRNTGSETWNPGEVFLGTTEPRDGASALVGADWVSAGRAATIDRVVPTGEVGRFNFTVRAPATPGEYPQYFNMVRETVAWFSDSGGPVDAFIQVRVTVVTPPDEDMDGVSAALDCDDHNATVHPGATDLCGDGVDQDCAGGDAMCAMTSDAFVVGADAAASLDGGTRDTGTRADAGPSRIESTCGCRAGVRAKTPWLLSVLGALWFVRRRRRVISA